MRLLRVGLRLSLIAADRPRLLLNPALRAACAQSRPFGNRSFSNAPLVRKDQSPPVKEAEAKPGSPKLEAGTPKSEEIKAAAQAESKPKPTLWQKVKKEAKHYWEGTKLLGYEVKVSTKLALKMASGRELSRREDRQLKRTVQDIVRLVPFSIFVIIPFAELLLPIALRLFPNLLPSTYETSASITAKSKKLGATRSSVGEYLRSSVKSKKMAVPDFSSEEQQAEFVEFFKQIREGETPSRTRLLTVARMFKDDMLLDNLSRPQLSAVAKYINIQSFGTSIILRYQIRHKMRLIKHDDRVIDYEGVDSLNGRELHAACQSRGFKTIGVSTGRLREDLSNWLQLRLHDRVPSTLLILSSAYTYGDHKLESMYDGILNVLSALPPEVYHETELEIHSDQATNAQRLEVLKEQDDLIREENKEEQESGHVVQVRDNLNVDDEENTPKPTTESEADVKADQEWYEKADRAAEQQAQKPQPTDSEVSAKADQEFYNEGAGKKPEPGTPQPTDSEVNAKADLEFYNQAEEASKSQPTDSEVSAKADQEFFNEAPKTQKTDSSTDSSTPSELAAKADQEFYEEAKKASSTRNASNDADQGAKNEKFTASEAAAKADQEFYEPVDTHKAHSASTDSEAAVKADQDFTKRP